MVWTKNKIALVNRQLSNVVFSQGPLECVGTYLYASDQPLNFMISGGANLDERYQPLYALFDSMIGRLPVIVLHNNDIHMEQMVIQAWQEAGISPEESPLWVVNKNSAEYEPFFGMSRRQIVAALKRLANKLNYHVAPKFDRVVEAHLSILDEMDTPFSLSGLYYLCQFADIGEFHDNIMQLPCGESKARGIWAGLGVDDEGENNQFDLFRTVINRLADDATNSGWCDDNCVAEWNCMQAVKQNATFVFSINDLYSEMLLPFLTEELKASRTPFLLLIDDIKIIDEAFRDYLRFPNTSCFVGIISANVVDLIGDEDVFYHLAEKMNAFILFKHGTGRTASVFSEVFGRYDYTKVETAQGTNRSVFSLFPQGRHDDVRYTTENRYRVMPEDITSLQYGQAIIFNTETDEIIRYN